MGLHSWKCQKSTQATYEKKENLEIFTIRLPIDVAHRRASVQVHNAPHMTPNSMLAIEIDYRQKSRLMEAGATGEIPSPTCIRETG